MDKRVVLLAALSVSVLSAKPAAGQAQAWQQKWFWGAQGGVFMYQTPTTTKRELAFSAGGHWLITGRRSALLIGFDQILFKSGTTSMIVDNTSLTGTRLVDFSTGRRIQALVYAVPSDSHLQIMLGGGFAIQQLTDAIPEGPFATVSEQKNAETISAEADTRAFAVVSAAFQLRRGRWALFGNYQFMPSVKDFLLTSEQHALLAGVRYALTTSHEDVTTQR